MFLLQRGRPLAPAEVSTWPRSREGDSREATRAASATSTFGVVAPRTEAGPQPGEEPALPVVWRVGRPALLVARVGTGLSLAAIAAVTAWVLWWPDADRTAAALAAAVDLVFVVLLWRMGLHPSLEATAAGLTVRNPLQTVEIPWAEVRETIPGYDGIRITRYGRPSVTVWAVQKANISTWSRARTRADVVAATIDHLARVHGEHDHAHTSTMRSISNEPEPRDAAALPLPFPWTMSRIEVFVVGELRHSSSPLLSGAVALLFAALALGVLGFLGDDLWNNHVLQQRGIVVHATVLAVPGQVKVTWPAIAPRAVFVDPGHPSGTYAVGDVVEVQSDPREPTLARLVGVKPDAGDRIRSGAVGVVGLFLAGAYAKWSRWLLFAQRHAATTGSGRHRTP